MSKVDKVCVVISSFLCAITILILVSLYWIRDNFHDVSMDSIVFHLYSPLVGAETVIFSYVIHAFSAVIFFFVFCYFFHKIPLLNIKKITLSMLCFILSIGYAVYALRVVEYMDSTQNRTSFIQDNYMHHSDISTIFHSKKRNIIVLALESLETGFTTDSFSKSLIPQLERVQKNNIFFPQLQQTTGTSWTIAALTAMTFGLPLKLPVHGNNYEGNMFEYFLPSAENILHAFSKNGYSISFILGSRATFSGKDNLFNTHTDTATIYDLKYHLEHEKGIHPERWGLVDEALYTSAKKIILEKVDTKTPFFLLVETVDTHNVIPVIDAYPKVYGDSRDTVLHADTMAAEFLSWLKKQSFYENTTVIILGDHRLMNNKLGEFELKGPRYLYNAIINAPFPMKEEYLHRKATMLDLAPTILACAGATLPQNRFGLGVSLFGTEKTLLEKFGSKQLAKELANKSLFYDTFFEK